MDVIHHRMPFQQLDLLLPALLPKQRPNLLPQFSINDLLAILWYNHYMVLTLPLDVGLTLPIFHDSSPWSFGAFLRENYPTQTTHETAEPSQFSPAKPVVYGTAIN
jgi:hypothetical protein